MFSILKQTDKYLEKIKFGENILGVKKAIFQLASLLNFVI